MEKVKVKILKHMTFWNPGDIVEVSTEEAKHLCSVGSVSDGEKVIEYRRAILLEEALAIESAPIDVSQLTQGEAEALGIKNITPNVLAPTPEEREMERLREENAPYAEVSRDESTNVVPSERRSRGRKDKIA